MERIYLTKNFQVKIDILSYNTRTKMTGVLVFLILFLNVFRFPWRDILNRNFVQSEWVTCKSWGFFANCHIPLKKVLKRKKLIFDYCCLFQLENMKMWKSKSKFMCTKQIKILAKTVSWLLLKRLDVELFLGISVCQLYLKYV